MNETLRVRRTTDLVGLLTAMLTLAASAGCSSSSNGTAAGRTVGNQCTDIASAFCARYGACGGTQTTSDCATTAAPACCGGSDKCGQAAISNETDVSTCVSDINAEACPTVTIPQLPASCAGVVKHTSASGVTLRGDGIGAQLASEATAADAAPEQTP